VGHVARMGEMRNGSRDLLGFDTV